MLSYNFLLDIALILISTKLLGLLTRKIKMTQVVGALLAGLILGPSVLNVLTETQFLSQLSELGVIVIMFSAGMETDLKELRKAGKAGFLVALCGVIIPLAMGALIAWGSAVAGLIPEASVLSYIFVGTVLTATSVSITVETLKELGHLSTEVGNTILAAALIDDVLGLIVLTIVTGFTSSDAKIWVVLIKIVLFFVFAFAVGIAARKIFNLMINRAQGRNLHRYPLFAFVLCLILSWCAEEFFGVSDIIGAFAAGIMISLTPKATYINSKFEPMSYLLLSPIFYASIGIGAVMPKADWGMIIFSLLLLVVAVVSKLIGCGLGAKAAHMTTRQSMQVGIGMVCRGEVALIVAKKALAVGVLSAEMTSPIIVTVVVSSVITPVLLKFVFREPAVQKPSGLVDHYNEGEQLDIVSERLLTANRSFMKHIRKDNKDNKE